jgi:hypothetical protein
MESLQATCLFVQLIEVLNCGIQAGGETTRVASPMG